MQLGELLTRLDGFEPRLEGDATRVVCDVCQDSRLVTSGALFVARSGQRAQGASYLAEALQRGAVAVLCEHSTLDTGALDTAALHTAAVPTLLVNDVSRALAIAAEAVHGAPSGRLSLVGITGTNGKTTTASLVQQALQALGHPVASLGTLGITLAGRTLDLGPAGSLTTAQADVLSRALATAVSEGIGHAVMEVSSHALDQGRVDALRFEVAAFTNLTQDHLDYHGDMDSYGRAKERLFRELNVGSRVYNVEDPFGAELWRRYGGIAVGRTHEADLSLSGLEVFPTHSELTVRTPQGRLTLNSSLVGDHNVDNWLLALGVLHALGVPLHQVAQVAERVTAAPGRMQRIAHPGQDVSVIVDYAHTPDALSRALQASRQLLHEPGAKLWCVFGCGGDRDRSKRPLMGEVAARLAERCVITNDNPRSEAPAAIAEQIVAEMPPGSYSVCLDRQEAIALALREASPGDVILIAGKGHEDYQLIGSERHHFDDSEVSARWLAERVLQAQLGGAGR
jgi:UDP-N-acetylmuramoyl-L-alanyl-D-glutamate--2,6-diaminopimelate ligase